MAIDIDNIPRTIDLVRNDSNTSVIPDGYPVLSIIDQTQLPYAEAYLHLTDWREAIEAIKQQQALLKPPPRSRSQARREPSAA